MSRAAARRLAEAWARSPRMVGRRIGEEYVLVPLAGRGADLDSILNLNRVAAFVWEQLDGETSGSEVVEAVLERFDVERERAEQDYLELVDTLVELGAVASAATPAGLSVPGAGAPSLARLAGALAYQQVMLADARRNRAFRRALAARVRPGASVLDLGAGTGVWAVAAARLGARRVVAVEREAVLVPVIEALAREAGVADRVEVVRADARRVRLRREFDLVVGELVGNEAFEEGLVPVFERARRALPAPGRGARARMGVARRRAGRGAVAARPVAAVPAVGERRGAHRPRPAQPASRRAQAARARPRAVPARPAHGARRRSAAHGPRELPRSDGRAVGGIAVWVVMGLAPGVRLATRAGTHWLPTLLPIEPQPRGPGRLEVEIDWNPARRRWSTRFSGASGRSQLAHYSPLFAWGSVRAGLRGHRRRH